MAHLLYADKTMSTALINPTLLSWSRIRAGLTEEEVAKGLPVKTEKVLEWEGGLALPTFRQAQRWAALAHIPFGFLFLNEPPDEGLPLPDLRTVGGVAPSKPSVNLLDTVKDVIRKHEWYLEYLEDHGRTPLPFVGRFTTNAAIPDVVADMRRTLGVGPDATRLNYDEYLRVLINAAEANGILVMRSGIVGSNTHRKLDVAEFRGFAISNEYAPIVFINSADAQTARLFTLIHELAHIWIGSSGISSGSTNSSRNEEIFCNAVAGEFLVPAQAFVGAWRRDIFWRDNLPELAARFRVSQLVIARQALDHAFISHETYSGYYIEELRAFRERDGSGGSFYRSAGAKNSVKFSRAVISEALSGNLLLRDAGKLLLMQPSHIKTYAGTLAE